MTELQSAIYRGKVTHSRHAPKKHAFTYSVFLVYLDLEELPTLFKGAWLWSFERFNLASYRRKHYLGPPEVPLRDAVRARVQEATGVAPPEGPIRLLTNVGYLGLCFNPVSFYYVFEPDGFTLHAIVAEITNTPWGERHQYVLVASKAGASGEYLEWRFDKDFHVSPFFDMDHRYRWRFTAPQDSPDEIPRRRLAVAMENRVSSDEGERIFDVTLTMERHDFTPKALRGALLRHPWMTGKVLFAIYWQALRLWVKRIPFFSHPELS